MKKSITTLLFLVFLVLLGKSSTSQVTYTFTGNGNWSDSSNWVNKLIPPLTLPKGDTIIINPNNLGESILDIPQIISPGASLIVNSGKKFTIINSIDTVLKKYSLGAKASNPDSLLSVPVLDTASFFARPLVFDRIFQLDMPDVGAQGDEGSCVAFACAYAARSYNLQRDEGVPYSYYCNILSPEFLYNVGKEDGTCVTAGMDLFTALNLMKNRGVATWEVMPYSDKNGCANVITPKQYTNALNYKIDSFYRISDISELYLKRVLSQKNPILFIADLDEGFWSSGKYIWKSNRGINKGYHAMVICGWNDSLHAYKVMNSYGTTWGFDGFGWIDYDYLKKILVGTPGLYEMFVIKTSSKNSFTDPRDGQNYTYKRIGCQVWMTQNLNYAASGSWCYDNNSANCTTYGRLYDWNTAKSVAPTGWHLPTDLEWTLLTNYLGGDAVAGGVMKEKGLINWLSPNTGADNSSGFKALPGGNRNTFGTFFGNIGIRAFWWSSSTSTTGKAWNRTVDKDSQIVGRGSANSATGQTHFSVRLIRDY